MGTRQQASTLFHSLLPERGLLFFETWMIEENGHGEEVPNNNPANLSYQGGELPTEEEIQKWPWFSHVTHVNENRVCVFDTLEHGCESTVLLLNHYFPAVKEASNDRAALEILAGPDVNGEHWASNPKYGEELVAVYDELVKQADVPDTKDQGGHLPVSPSNPLWYRVVGGDSLWEIAERHHITLSELEKLNPQIVNPNQIYVGEEVRVK